MAVATTKIRKSEHFLLDLSPLQTDVKIVYFFHNQVADQGL
jgi:hypothetical protein